MDREHDRRNQTVRLALEQSQTPAQGRAVLWMCRPEHEGQRRLAMRRLRRLLAENVGADVGRMRFYELGGDGVAVRGKRRAAQGEIPRAMERAEFDSCAVFVPGTGWENAAVELIAAAHRFKIHVVLVVTGRFDACPAALLSELDFVVADRGETLQFRKPDGEILAETPWN